MSGLAFLALLGVVFFLANVLPSPGYPSPFQDLATVGEFFSQSRATVRLQSLALALTSVVLLVFVGSLNSWLRETKTNLNPLLWVSFGAGLLASGFVMLSAMFAWTLSRPETLQNPSLLRALHDATYLMGGPAHVVTVALFFGVTSLVMRDTGAFPNWLFWSGTIGALVSGLAVVGLVWEPATFVLVASRIVLTVWILGVCATLATSRVGRLPGSHSPQSRWK